MSTLCAEASAAAGERLAGTSVTAWRWLLVEVPGAWPRDVASGDGLPDEARAAVEAWLGSTPGGRLQYIRRPDRPRDRVLVWVVDARETERAVTRIELSSLDELASADLEGGDPVDAPLVLVCGHGSRDRCCALRGTSVFGALTGAIPDEQLWISSHLGGHRFAANVLVLPAGIQLGRVETDEAQRLVEEALSGRIALDRYRGRTCYERAAQAAEHALRVHAGLVHVDDLRLADVAQGVVSFRSGDGSVWSLAFDEVEGPEVPASCGDQPAPQRALAARVVSAEADTRDP